LEEKSVRKTVAVFIILALAIAVLALASFNNSSVRASSTFSVQSVNHTVGVLYNGYVLVNDTITTSGQTGSFLLGLPHSFGPSVVSVIAYSTGNAADTFPVSLNVPFEDHVGFYGVSVDFSKGTPQVFSVVFVLSDRFSELNSTIFELVFPTFPSLTETAPVCNSSVVVPDAQYVNGTVSGLTYNVENLSAFTYNTSQVDLLIPAGSFQMFDIQQLTRDVNINAFGKVSVSDLYYVTNNSTSMMDSMDFVLPPNASNVAANDQVGIPTITPPAVNSKNPNRYTINFTFVMYPGEAIKFTVSYDLPDNVYVSKQGGSFALNMSFFQDSISYIDQASVGFFLPQGAHLSDFETTLAGNLYGVNRDVYQDRMSVSEQNVIPLDSFTVNFSYTYNPLWLALGPALWVFVFAMVGSAVVWIWKRPRAPSGVVIPSTARGGAVHPEDYRAFADAYEEKMKIEEEIDVLDERVQKGRIPRRRYKVQKKTLETRLSALDRTLAETGGKLHAGGGHYSSMMRQLEVAEAEIDEAEGSIRSIEARQTRGEISMETYRKLLADYERRKDRARTAIRGILLRLREETY
jgi:hypothetical protein